MVVCAGVVVLVECCSAVFFREQFLNFPVVLLGADGELEILAGNGIPILPVLLANILPMVSVETNLVHHHYSQQVANSSKEKSIEVMLDSITDLCGEYV